MSTVVISPDGTVTVTDTTTTTAAPVAPVTPAPVAPVTPAPVAPVTPAPVAPVAPANFINQQTVSCNNHVPVWLRVVIIIISILMFIAFLSFLGYLAYKPNAQNKEQTPTTIIVEKKSSHPVHRQIAVDPEARVSAAEANTKADILLQERDSKNRLEAEMENQKNKKSEKPDCEDKVADWFHY